LRKFLMCLVLAIVLGLGVQVLAGDNWTVQPRYPYAQEGGVLSPGSRLNPYELKDSYGRTRGTIQPRYPDLIPNDGVLNWEINPWSTYPGPDEMKRGR